MRIRLYLADPDKFLEQWSAAPNIVSLKDEIDLLQKKLSDMKQYIKNFTIDLSKENDPDTREIITEERTKIIKQKDDFERGLSFKRQQLKEENAQIDVMEEYRKKNEEAKKTKRRLRKEDPNGTVSKDGIRRKAMISLPDARAHLIELPFEEKKRIIRLFFNPSGGGKVSLRLDEHGAPKVDFHVKSTFTTHNSIIESLGGSDFFKRRL